MSIEEPETSTGQRTRIGESAAPIGSTLSIVLAVVAAVLGFFILRQISNEGGTSISSADVGTANGQISGGDGTASEGDEDPDPGDDDPTQTTEPQPQNQFSGARVVVANGARQDGLAGIVSDQVIGVGFNVPGQGAAINADPAVGTVEQTTIYYRRLNDDAEAVAETLRRAFGDESIPIETFSDAAPVPGDFSGGVVVVVGTDHADTELVDPPEPTSAPQPGQDGSGDDEG